MLGLDNLHPGKTFFLVPAKGGISFLAFFCLWVAKGHEPQPARSGSREHDENQAQPTPPSFPRGSYRTTIIGIMGGHRLVLGGNLASRHEITPIFRKDLRPDPVRSTYNVFSPLLFLMLELGLSIVNRQGCANIFWYPDLAYDCAFGSKSKK
jgi:hypothetical protein